jgi:hypothetical protein
MAKPNYQFEKRQRDLAKKAKQEEKRRQKLAAKTAAEGGDNAEADSGAPRSSNTDSAAEAPPAPRTTPEP